MDVRNFTQFANLLNTKQLIHIHPSFGKLFTCFMLYNSMCNCGGDSNQNKSNKHAECNRIYRDALGLAIGIKANLFQGISDNTISFYMDDIHLIKTICR